MTVSEEINKIGRKIKEEVNSDVNLQIGDVEDPALAVPILCERMDTICAMMDFQAEIISHAETGLEEARFLHDKKKLTAKQKYNTEFVKFKQEDKGKPRGERKTDKECEAMAELECHILMNEALTAERDYIKSQHKLADEKHRYEVLNNHFLSYRKASDMLVKEMNTFMISQKKRP